jgi:hypothetical protein
MYTCKEVKGEVNPITGHERPEGEQTYSFTLYLTSAVDGLGGQRHAPAALSPTMRPATNCIGGWMGPRAILDWSGKSRLHLDSISGPSVLVNLRVSLVESFIY